MNFWTSFCCKACGCEPPTWSCPLTSLKSQPSTCTLQNTERRSTHRQTRRHSTQRETLNKQTHTHTDTHRYMYILYIYIYIYTHHTGLQPAFCRRSESKRTKPEPRGRRRCSWPARREALRFLFPNFELRWPKLRNEGVRFRIWVWVKIKPPGDSTY